MVGRGGVEPPTSRLSGVRSNHLSYRPPACRPKGRGRREPAQAFAPSFDEAISRMKGHEDGGMFFGQEEAFRRRAPALSAMILRKEVIQPQVPLRLPCYDFTPVAEPTVVGCLPCGLAHHLRVNPTPMV